MLPRAARADVLWLVAYAATLNPENVSELAAELDTEAARARVQSARLREHGATTESSRNRGREQAFASASSRLLDLLGRAEQSAELARLKAAGLSRNEPPTEDEGREDERAANAPVREPNLNAEQLDGIACVHCGRTDGSMRPQGSFRGVTLFAHDTCEVSS